MPERKPAKTTSIKKTRDKKDATYSMRGYLFQILLGIYYVLNHDKEDDTSSNTKVGIQVKFHSVDTKYEKAESITKDSNFVKFLYNNYTNDFTKIEYHVFNGKLTDDLSDLQKSLDNTSNKNERENAIEKVRCKILEMDFLCREEYIKFQEWCKNKDEFYTFLNKCTIQNECLSYDELYNTIGMKIKQKITIEKGLPNEDICYGLIHTSIVKTIFEREKGKFTIKNFIKFIQDKNVVITQLDCYVLILNTTDFSHHNKGGLHTIAKKILDKKQKIKEPITYLIKYNKHNKALYDNEKFRKNIVDLIKILLPSLPCENDYDRDIYQFVANCLNFKNKNYLKGNDYTLLTKFEEAITKKHLR
jgi:hypothetical protein